MDTSNFSWAECTRISDEWINQLLNTHGILNKNKLVVRSYSLKFSGTQYQMLGLVEGVVEYIKQYVLSPEEIANLEKQGKDAYRRAMHYFGDTNPENDGKYGELILYLFTESVLKAPMIAHKMTLLTNTRDQIKGGDGVFFGSYNGQHALMIGESKIEQQVSTAITHALQSLDRFHNELSTSSQYKHELVIASQFIRKDFSKEQLDYLYDSLTPGTEVFRNNLLVHPTLIIYEDSQIRNIERACKNNIDGERLMGDRMEKRIPEIVANIQTKLDDFENVSSLYLDFFFMPVSSVEKLRYAMYEAIHGVPYKKQEKVVEEKNG